MSGLFEHWAALYREQTGIVIDYRPGSAKDGVRGVLDHSLDFVCVEVLPKDPLFDRACEEKQVTTFPIALDAVVPVYHLPQVTQPLVFNGNLLSAIYLGRVTRWDDPAVKALNPGVPLPPQNITPVHQKSQEETAVLWDHYLTRSTPDWKESEAQRKAALTGTTVEDNGNVARVLDTRLGAIGYTNYSFAVTFGLVRGQLRNGEGVDVVATTASLTAAAKEIEVSSLPDTASILPDSRNLDAYPAVSVLQILVRLDQQGERGEVLIRFLRWINGEGQRRAADRNFAPLPPSESVRIESRLAALAGGVKNNTNPTSQTRP